MMKKYFFATICLVIFGSTYAQHNINDYKYIIVEKQFHFQTEPNQYDLNRLVKFQFEKLGFNVIVEGQKLPDDLKSNYCLALTSEVTAKGMLRTKAQVTLRNCHGESVLVSGEGITKEKDLTRAFDVAIRKAFETMRGLNYRYVPNEAITSIGGNQAEDVKKAEKKIEELEAEIKELKKEEVNTMTEHNETNEQIESSETPKDKPQISVVKKVDMPKLVHYYRAVPTQAGLEIRDNQTQELLFKAFKSSAEHIYLLEDNAGILIKKGDVWGREYVREGKTVFEPLDIRF